MKTFKRKKIKLKNSNSIMKLGINNFKNLDKIKKLISLNEINMLNKSIYNLNQKYESFSKIFTPPKKVKSQNIPFLKLRIQKNMQ